jgi:hypothetical protein
MKLLTHNFLASPVKGAAVGYPLALVVERTEERAAEFNSEFVARMLPRLNYPVLRDAASVVRDRDRSHRAARTDRMWELDNNARARLCVCVCVCVGH